MGMLGKHNPLVPSRSKEYRRIDNKRRKKLRRDWLWEQKDKPCMDCGLRYPHEEMDFHHVPGRGVKVQSVSLMALSKSKELTLLEIAKCDLVCENCHRARHGGLWQNKPHR